jgi:hypothetical protein
MDVVGVAIVGGADGDDRLELGRPPSGDLKRVEAAPRLSDHPDRAGAPGLAGEPSDHLERVVLFLRQVLVQQHAVRVAAPAHVHPHGRVAVAGEIGVKKRVSCRRSVALAVGDVLQNRRHRVGLGVLGEPDPRGEAAPVSERDPRVADLAERPRKVSPDAHGD